MPYKEIPEVTEALAADGLRLFRLADAVGEALRTRRWCGWMVDAKKGIPVADFLAAALGRLGLFNGYTAPTTLLAASAEYVKSTAYSTTAAEALGRHGVACGHYLVITDCIASGQAVGGIADALDRLGMPPPDVAALWLAPKGREPRAAWRRLVAGVYIGDDAGDLPEINSVPAMAEARRVAASWDDPVARLSPHANPNVRGVRCFADLAGGWRHDSPGAYRSPRLSGIAPSAHSQAGSHHTILYQRCGQPVDDG
jgi:adenine/guanine phosphoribosyltransferase-like PRPP-binding protein